MRITKIESENADEFNGFLSEDLIEDIGRKYYGGIGVFDDDDFPVGALVYELLGVNSDVETMKSRIVYVHADNDEVWSAIMDGYDDSVNADNIEITTYETEDEGAAAMLESFGFSREKKRSRMLRFKVSDLESIKLKLKMRIPTYITGISELSFLQFRNGIKNFLFKGVKCAVEDIAYLPVSWFDKDVSSCCISDGKVVGMFLIRRNPSGSIQVILYTCTGPESRQNLAYMLIRTVNMALAQYPHDTEVMIYCRTGEIVNLVEHILPGHVGNEVFVGSRKE